MQKAYRMNSGKSTFVNAKWYCFLLRKKLRLNKPIVAEISGFKPRTDYVWPWQTLLSGRQRLLS